MSVVLSGTVAPAVGTESACSRKSPPGADGLFVVGCLSSALAVDLQQQLTGENPSPWSASSLLLRSVAVSPGQAGFEGALWTLCSPASLSRLPPGTARTAVVIPGTYGVEWQRCLRETQRLVQSGVDQVLLLLTDALRHDGSCTVAAVEELFAGALCRDGVKLRILRLGRVLHPSSRTAALLSCLQATLPAAVSVSCLHLPELVEIIENEVSAGFSNHSRTGSSPVVLSIPGARRSMREAVFAENSRSFGVGWRLLTKLLRAVGFGWLLFAWLRMASLVLPKLRDRLSATISPRIRRDLVCLCNRHTRQQIQLAGCNHGVNHFGWKFPGKSVVQTTSVPGRIRVYGGQVTVDAGVTLKAVVERLAIENRELPVTPNFSWISMGTCFFVPVHGSGSRMSTLGDAIQRVLLYDWERERVFSARRGDGLFEDAMYNRHQPWLLLRMTLLTQPRTAFAMSERKLESPSADEVLEQFEDPQASHVEIRKSRAVDSSVVVRSWRVCEPVNGVATLPRDQIGRIWDRLEETPLISSLFHWFVRTFAFHVELFLTAEEFRIFWERHGALPLSKIQLRRMRRDGMKHSACCTEDRISVDLFMLRGSRDVFCRFVSEELPRARSNPGKQSF
jgi:hypothetical protein